MGIFFLLKPASRPHDIYPSRVCLFYWMKYRFALVLNLRAVNRQLFGRDCFAILTPHERLGAATQPKTRALRPCPLNRKRMKNVSASFILFVIQFWKLSFFVSKRYAIEFLYFFLINRQCSARLTGDPLADKQIIALTALCQ